MQHLKNAPCIASQRQSSRGVLEISHIVGASPLPCPRYYGGGLSGRVYLSPSYVLSEYPNVVLTECYIFCRVVNVHLIGSFGILDRCRLKEAML